MKGTLLEDFTAKRPRESAGPRSSNRFDYQKNWAICKLLELHSADEDFLMVLDYHEDIVVFDQEISPTSAEFYQIKTSTSANWTIGRLTKQKNSLHDSSIINKLYTCYLNFSDETRALHFVSNQPIRAIAKDSTKRSTFHKVCFNELCSNDKEAIRDASVDPSSNQTDLVGLKKITLSDCALHLVGHDTYTKGKLVEYFDKCYPGFALEIPLVHKTIFDEVRKKTNYEEECRHKSDLLLNKSIGKSDFDQIVNIVTSSKSRDERWPEIQSMLHAEGMPNLAILKVKFEWQKFIIDDMDASNEALNELKSQLVKSIIIHLKSGYTDTLIALSNDLIDELEVDEMMYTKFYVLALVMNEVITNDSISEANSEPSEKEA